jgi:hypothetical protein
MPIQASAPQLPRDKELAGKILENTGSIDKLKAERGWLGGFWGASSHIPHNIAASLIFLLVIAGVVYTFCKIMIPTDDKSLPIKDFWAIITPLITLAIGYLFGEKSKPSSE